MTLKRLNIRQQRPVTPEKWETSEMYPTVALVSCMEGFQAVVQAWEHRQSPVISQLEDMQLGVQENQGRWSLQGRKL